MSAEIIRIYERMASSGTAPEDGCRLFGVGYEDAYERLRRTYLRRRFERGDSGEKFVVGPFGSGKTHFMRQLMELAREEGCVTAEVKLDKNIDFANPHSVYQEVMRAVRTPEGGRGTQQLFRGIAAKVARAAGDEHVARELVIAWAGVLEQGEVELPAFGAVARKAVTAIVNDDRGLLESAIRWLQGDFGDRAVARDLGVPQVPSHQQKNFARKAMLSAFQVIRHAGYRGTVVCYDEAEQGMSVDRKKTERILSMLQSDINALADVRNASALIVYGLTPDLFEKMDEFAALQQRIADPEPGRGFLDGSTYAPRIDLRGRTDDLQDLRQIAAKLVEVFHEYVGTRLTASLKSLQARADEIAISVHEGDARAGNRRNLVKRTCEMLLDAMDAGGWERAEDVEPEV